jgi:hypothetical protein
VDDPLPRRVVERRQVVRVQLQGHLLGDAGSELKLGEALELLGRLLGCGRCRDVELDDLGPARTPTLVTSSETVTTPVASSTSTLGRP